MSERKTYLVTGTSRGIGLGLASAILQQPGATLIAAVRDTAKASSSLEALPKADGAKLIVVKIDSQSDTDPAAAVKKLQEEHGITSLDVVIANAGIAYAGTPVSKISTEIMREHLNVNTIAPIVLFQALQPLLKASKSPVFMPISTNIGSIAAQGVLIKMFPPVFAAYGSSKAALNWLVTRIHFEEPWLTTFVVHPGLVTTDMGSGLIAASEGEAETYGAIDAQTSAGGLLKLVNGASREEYGGTFRSWDNKIIPW